MNVSFDDYIKHKIPSGVGDVLPSKTDEPTLGNQIISS